MIDLLIIQKSMDTGRFRIDDPSSEPGYDRT